MSIGQSSSYRFVSNDLKLQADRVRLSVKDFELCRAFPVHLVIKKSNSVSVLITNWTRFSLFWSPSFDSQMSSSHGSSVFFDVATIKTHRVKPLLKKGGKSKKEEKRSFVKSQFCREKKKENKERKQEAAKKSAAREIWLSCAWCMSNMGLNFQKTFIKKNKCIYGFLLGLKSQTE